MALLSDGTGRIGDMVFAINIALNLSLEYLYDTFVVYRNEMDNNDVAARKRAKEEQKNKGSVNA